MFFFDQKSLEEQLMDAFRTNMRAADVQIKQEKM